MVCLRYQSTRLCRICTETLHNWRNTTDRTLKNIMQNHAKTGKKIYSSLMIISYLIITLYLCNPILQPRENTSNTPLQTFCVFMNLKDNEYISIYFLESVGFFYMASCFIGTDSFFFGMAMHLCGQLDVLQNEFSSIVDSTRNSTFKKRMTVLVKKHLELIRFAKDINTIFSLILLLQILIHAFLITSQGTQDQYTIIL